MNCLAFPSLTQPILFIEIVTAGRHLQRQLWGCCGHGIHAHDTAAQPAGEGGTCQAFITAVAAALSVMLHAMLSHLNVRVRCATLQVLLQGGDLLMMHGDARYLWRHGIAGVQEERYEGDMPPWQQLHCTSQKGASEEASGLGRAGPVWDDSSSNAAATAAAALEMGVVGFEGQGCGLEGTGAGQVQGRQGWHQGPAQDAVSGSCNTGKAGEAGTGGSDRKACGQRCLVQGSCAERQGLEQGVRVVRGLRLSVTLRRLCSDIVLTEQ